MRTAKATPEEWRKALGVDEKGERTPAMIQGDDEGVELPICCGNISHARDLLVEVMLRGELSEKDAEMLELNLEHDLPENIPILTRICTDLGITLYRDPDAWT